MPMPELADDTLYDCFNRRIDRNGDRVFLRPRRLQRLELAVQQVCRHEMTLAAGQALGNQGLASIEKNDSHVLSAANQYVAVGAFQGRAGDHDMRARPAHALDLVGDGAEPGPAILIGQWMTRGHLGDIAGGMKSVAILKRPA